MPRKNKKLFEHVTQSGIEILIPADLAAQIAETPSIDEIQAALNGIDPSMETAASAGVGDHEPLRLTST